MTELDNIPNGWTVGIIIACNEDKQTPIAGWVKAPFGIDFRVLPDAEEVSAIWAITHLKSGYSAGAWIGSATDVMRLADQMAAVADWDFETAAEMKVERALMQDIWDKYQGGVRVPAGETVFGSFT